MPHPRLISGRSAPVADTLIRSQRNLWSSGSQKLVTSGRIAWSEISDWWSPLWTVAISRSWGLTKTAGASDGIQHFRSVACCAFENSESFAVNPIPANVICADFMSVSTALRGRYAFRGENSLIDFHDSQSSSISRGILHLSTKLGIGDRFRNVCSALISAPNIYFSYVVCLSVDSLS